MFIIAFSLHNFLSISSYVL